MKFHGILAVAVLAAGATWLAAKPDDECAEGPAALLDAPSVTALCERVTALRPLGPYSGKPAGPGSADRDQRAAEELARLVGLPGLARSSGVLSLTDLGGVAAGAGRPALPARVPTGLTSIAELAEYPDLPTAISSPAPRRTGTAKPESARSPQFSGGTIRLPEPLPSARKKAERVPPESATEIVEHVPGARQEPVNKLTDLLTGLGGTG